MRLRKGEGRAVLRMVRGAMRLRRYLVAELLEGGLTPMQVEVLLEIRRENRASQALLARRLQVSRQAIDEAVAELERAELIERAPDVGYDGRSWLWGLTEEGSSRLDTALDVLVGFEERSFPRLDDEERGIAAELIEAAVDRIAHEERMRRFPLRQRLG